MSRKPPKAPTCFLATLLIFSMLTPSVSAAGKKDRGTILVGVPEIVSRERLVNDRLAQEEWLLKQLEAADKESFGFQGGVDVRSFFGVTASAGINADPKALERYGAESQGFLEDLERQQELAKLQHRLEMLKLKEQIRQIEEGEDDGGGSGGETKDGEATPDAEEVASSPGGATSPARPIASAAGVAQGFLDRLTAEGRSGLLPNPASLALADKVKGTPTDQFRERLAYREEIRNELLENQLDDAHDLLGNTLYRLNFDVTVIPKGTVNAWAMVDVKVKGDCQDTDDLHEQWRRQLEKELSEIMTDRWLVGLGCLEDSSVASKNGCGWQASYQRDLLIFGMTSFSSLRDEDLEHLSNIDSSNFIGEVQKYSMRLTPREAEQVTQALPENASSYQATLKVLDDLRLYSPIDEARVLATAFQGGADELESELRRLVDQLLTKYPGESKSQVLRRLVGEELVDRLWKDAQLSKYLLKAEVNKNGRFGVEIPVKKGDTELQERQDGFKKKICASRLYAYAATPKESVQRISEVAAQRNSLELSAAAAMLTGSASIDATLGLIRETQRLLQGISRPPLVVGFTYGQDKPQQDKPQQDKPQQDKPQQDKSNFAAFGWLIGPKFELTKSTWPWSKGYRFAHVPIQNAVAATVSLPAWWTQATVEVCRQWQGVTEDGVDLKSCSDGEKQTYTIRLPGQVSALTRIFLQNSEPFVEQNQSYQVVSGERADLLIEGRDLWRSTEVTLGGQRASRIRVLPNMRGILATFDPVQAAATFGDSKEPRRVDVNVWTSRGKSQAGEALVYSGKPKPSTALKVTLETRHLVKKGRVRLAIAQGALPAGYAKVEIGLRQRNRATGGFADWRSKPASLVDGKLEADFEPADFTGWTSGEEAQARVFIQLRPSPGEGDLQIILDTLWVFYATDAEIKVAGPDSVKVGSPKIELKLPVRATVAFPGLTVSTAIKVTKAGVPVTLQNLTWERAEEPWTVSFELTGVAAGEKVQLAFDPAVADLQLVNGVVEVKP